MRVKIPGCDSVRTGWKPVRDTSGDAGETRAMTPTGRSKDAWATMPAQRRQRCMRKAGNDANAIRARTPVQCRQRHLRCIGRTIEGQSPAMTPGRATKPLAMTMRTETSSHILPCCGCIMTGQTPICYTGCNAGAARVATPAQRGRRHPRDKGDNAGATPVSVTMQHWQ
jgi:hypothetical protein